MGTEKSTKIVLTGGPSSGKSSLVREREKRGHNVIHEMARDVLEERREFPLTPSEWETRQKLIYGKQLAEEEKASGLVFLDRSILDGVAYSNHLLGYVPFEVADTNYDLVCNLERLPLVNDGLRIESTDQEAQTIHDKILETYSDFNYVLLSIPSFNAPTIEQAIFQRTDYLLSKMEEILDDRN